MTSAELACCFILLVAHPSAAIEIRDRVMKIYYDRNGETVPVLNISVRQGVTNQTEVQTFGFLPCNCFDWTCGCCVNISFFNFQRYSCSNFTYNPFKFSINMNLLMNNESIYENSVSAKNPPPACLEPPVPYLPSVQFCLKMFDIYTVGRNMHMCLNLETKIVRAPILVLQFDCVQMGYDGFFFGKPFVNITLPPLLETSSLAPPTGNSTQRDSKVTKEPPVVLSEDDVFTPTTESELLLELTVFEPDASLGSSEFPLDVIEKDQATTVTSKELYDLTTEDNNPANRNTNNFVNTESSTSLHTDSSTAQVESEISTFMYNNVVESGNNLNEH